MVPQYWCDAALIIEIREGSQRSSIRNLGQPYAIIGSASRATIQLPSGQVPKRKYYLHATDAGVYCIDLEPKPGEEHVHGWWLSPDQWLEAGNFHIAARLDHPPVESPHGRSDLFARRSLEHRQPLVQVWRRKRLLVNRAISRHLTLLGRTRPCSFRVESRSISAVHAALFWDRDRMWIIDLASAAGVLSHDEQQAVVTLAEQEAVRLGNYELRLALSDISADPQTAPVSVLLPGDEPQASDGERVDQEADVLVETRPLDGEDRDRASSSLARAQAQLEQESEAARKSLTRWDAEMSVLLTEQQTLLRERHEVESHHRQLEAEAARLELWQRDLGKAAAASAEQQVELDRQGTESIVRRERLDAEVAQLEALRTQLQGVQSREQELRDEQSRLNEIRRQLEQELADASGARHKWEADAAQLVSELEQQRRLADASVASTRLAESASQDLANLREQVAREFAEAAAARVKCETAANRLDEERTSVLREQREIDVRRRRYEELELDLTTRREQFNVDAAALNTQRNAVQSAKNDLEVMRGNWEAENAELNKRRQELDAQWTAAEVARALSESEASRLAAARERLEFEINESLAARRRWQAELERISSETSSRRRDEPDSHELRSTPPATRLAAPEAETWSLKLERGRLVAPDASGAFALRTPAPRPRAMLAPVPVQADDDAEPAVSDQMILAQVGGEGDPRDDEVVDDEGSLESGFEFSTSDAQAERMTAQLTRRTAQHRRRHALWTVLGFILLIGAATCVVAGIWMNRDHWNQKP